MNVSRSGLIIKIQGHSYELHSPLKEDIQIVSLAKQGKKKKKD